MPARSSATQPPSELPAMCGVAMFISSRKPATAAVDSLDMINADYLRHCRAAREIAEAYFDAEPIITTILDGSHQVRTTCAGSESW
jgi:hypothetical protein